MTPAVPFMVTAVLLLPLLGAGAAWAAPSLARGNFRAWHVLAVNHLATLGWGTLTAMGAMYQMFPAMIGASVRPDRRAAIQLAAHLIGLMLMIAGFLTHNMPVVVFGGIAVIASVVGFIVLITRAIPQRRRWTLTATGSMIALGYLVLTVSWGLVLGMNSHHRFWPSLLTYAGVGTHASIGLIGWFAQLVISESYYLLPRFMNGRQIGEGRLRYILPLLNGGVVMVAVGALWTVEVLARAGVAGIAAAAAIYAGDLWRFLAGTRGERPDLTTQHWWVIWGLTVALAVTGLAWAAGFVPVEGYRLGAAAGVIVLLGWVTLAVMGQLYKVTPFLMWHYRFAKGMTPLEVPRLPAPYYPREGIAPFYLTTTGGALLSAAVVAGRPPLGVVGGLLLLIGGLGFWYLMAVSWIRAAASPSPS